jgi:hypothetical protein
MLVDLLSLQLMKMVIMARKSKPSALALTQWHRATLQELSASRVAPAREVDRSELMLGYADGVSDH